MLERSVANRIGLSKKLFVRLSVVILGSLVMMGCDVSRSWKEEVKLSDGSVIVIKRRMVRERFGEIGHHGAVLKQEIKFAMPGSAIHWIADIDPVVLESVNGKHYLVAYLNTGEECRRYGYPDSRFLFYEHSGSDWRRIRSQEFPDGFAFNLLRAYWYKAQPSLITLDMKAQRDWNSPEYFKKFDKNAIRPCPKY